MEREPGRYCDCLLIVNWLVRVKGVDWGPMWVSGRESYAGIVCGSVDWGVRWTWDETEVLTEGSMDWTIIEIEL